MAKARKEGKPKRNRKNLVKSQKRLQITKRMMDNIASQHYREAARFEQLKRVINYKTNE